MSYRQVIGHSHRPTRLHGILTDNAAGRAHHEPWRLTPQWRADRLTHPVGEAGYLKKAGVAADPILDWQHLSRRVQIAKTTAKGLGCLTNAERRAPPLIAKALESVHWKL